MISLKLRQAVKLSEIPQYKIARQAGMHPVVLSQILTGYTIPKNGDARVVKVGEIVGLQPEECFVEEVGEIG